MSLDAIRALAAVHGALAWALVLALGWAVVSSTRGRAPLPAFAISAALAAAAGATGLLLDEPYRARLRQSIFVESPALGWLFERKEHVALGAVLLALSGLAALLGARLATGGESPSPARADLLLRAARRAAAAAALFALAASIASAIVGAHRRF